MEHIADRLVRSIQEKKSPIVVGIDPVYENIPEGIREKYSRDVDGVAGSFLEFGKHIIDAIYDVAPAIKPQSAFYELLGWQGIRALEETMAYATSKGLLVIDDSKRGDIGNTSQAYAAAHIGSLELDGECLRTSEADFMTVSPFLGIDGIEPFTEAARLNNKGVFLLVRTSNPGSGLFQSAITGAGKTVAEELADHIEALGQNLSHPSHMGTAGYSSVGAVVGATYPDEAKKLRQCMPHSFLLVPGYGAQGATAEDMAVFFNPDGLGALVNASRSIIFAHMKAPDFDGSVDSFKATVRAAAESMRDDIHRVLESGFKDLSY